jgi:hypothetical protein
MMLAWCKVVQSYDCSFILLSFLVGSQYMFALSFNKISHWMLSGECIQGGQGGDSTCNRDE